MTAIPDDGYADGGEPYMDEELDTINTLDFKDQSAVEQEGERRLDIGRLCLCGKDATSTAYLPSNIYAGLRQMMGPHRVCPYHAQKARDRGYEVE